MPKEKSLSEIITTLYLPSVLLITLCTDIIKENLREYKELNKNIFKAKNSKQEKAISQVFPNADV